MPTITITYDFYSPRNSKCRACTYFPGLTLGGYCACKDNKIRTRYRYHNSKACSWFKADRERLESLEEK